MTTPNACNRKRPSPHCAAPVPSRRRRDGPYATGSIGAATAKPTMPCGGSPSPACVTTRPPSPTPKKDKQKAKPPGDHPLPETAYRPPDLPPAHQSTRNSQRRPSSLSTQKRANNPHPRRHSPTQYASHNSSEASTTTITSPPDTTNGSPPSHPTKTRFDNHRSIKQSTTSPSPAPGTAPKPAPT